ncbi:hypothetical protein B0H21DRAFT_713213 [Amylocystis lapponica]|nr:hypothetical protein B0H21DRAFT_713213 [Amylocystis lapponica]
MHHHIQNTSGMLLRHNDILKGEWDLQINYSSEHKTEQEPKKIDSNRHQHESWSATDSNKKDTGVGLILWGHPEFEWRSAPLPEQPISPMERYRGRRTSAPIISLEPLSYLDRLSLLHHLNAIEASVPESDDVEYLGRDSHMDKVLGWADDVMRCQPTISVPPRTPLMRPVVLPGSAYDEDMPIDVVLDEEAVVEDGCEVEMESAQAADGSTPDSPYFEGPSSERAAIHGAPFPAPVCQVTRRRYTDMMWT